MSLHQSLSLLEAAFRQTGPESFKGLRLTARLRRDLEFYFRQLERAVGSLGLEALAGRAAAVAQEATRRVVAPVIEALRPLLLEILAAHLEGALVQGQADADQRVGQEAFQEQDFFQLGLTSQQAAALARELAAQRVTGIDAETQRRLADLVARGVGEGLSPQALGRLIRTELVSMTRFRAELIANTEMADAMSQATMERMAARGVKFKTIILSHAPCPICRGNKAEGPIPMDQAFQSGHQRVPFHPNCQCALVPSREPRSE